MKRSADTVHRSIWAVIASGALALIGAYLACDGAGAPTQTVGGDALVDTGAEPGPSFDADSSVSDTSKDTNPDAESSSYPKPVWSSVNPSVCPVDRLQNPLAVGPLFDWIPCANTALADCAELRVTEAFMPSGADIQPQTVARDDGVDVWLAFVIKTQSAMISVIAREDGAIVAAFRSHLADQCFLQFQTLGDGRFEARIVEDPSTPDAKALGHEASMLGPLALGATTVQSPPFEAKLAGSANGAFSNGRLAWWWPWYTRLSSMSATDGSDFIFFSGPPEGGGEVGPPRSCSGLFLFEQRTDQIRIVSSDGKTAPAPYYAELGDASASEPRCFNGYLAWQKGIGKIGLAQYQKAELWASPFSPDPAGLKPAKVADLPFTYSNSSNAADHWVHAFADGNHDVHVFHVPDGKHRHFALPQNERTYEITGVGRSYVYVPICPFPGEPNVFRTIYRIGIASLPVVE